MANQMATMQGCCCSCDLVAGMSITLLFGWTYQFTDTSTTSGTISSWLWDFGDGNTSTLQNPTHTYLAPGSYTVTLTVTDENCTREATGGVTIGGNECTHCTPDDLPDEVAVTVSNGTSARGCVKCTTMAGTYVLDIASFCAWEYFETVNCIYCTGGSVPGDRPGQFIIRASVLESGGVKKLWVQVTWSASDTGHFSCEYGKAEFELVLGSGSQDCRGSHTLTKVFSEGLNLCTHASTVTLFI